MTLIELLVVIGMTVILSLIIFCGCASPSHSYAAKSTVLGLEMAYDETYRLPLLRLGYISADGAAVLPEASASIRREYRGVSIIQPSGDISSELSIAPGRARCIAPSPHPAPPDGRDASRPLPPQASP
jgi:hypothetical protein